MTAAATVTNLRAAISKRSASLQFLVGREVSLVVGCYLVYAAAKNIFDSTPILRAYGNAWRIVRVENTLGLDIEGTIQIFTARISEGFLDAIAWFYWTGLWIGLVVTAVGLFITRRRLYFEVRTIFLVTMAIALVIFALYPLAPPRMLPGYGLSDMVVLLGLNPMEHSRSVFSYNKFAAMPSLHVTWALLVAYAWYRSEMKWPAILAGMYAVLMAFAVIATANHYVMDVIGGGCLFLLATWSVHRWSRRRRLPKSSEIMPPEYYWQLASHVGTATRGLGDSPLMSWKYALLNWL